MLEDVLFPFFFNFIYFMLMKGLPLVIYQCFIYVVSPVTSVLVPLTLFLRGLFCSFVSYLFEGGGLCLLSFGLLFPGGVVLKVLPFFTLTSVHLKDSRQSN